ncbi:MAG: ester cyclase [Terriglobales bacterium]
MRKTAALLFAMAMVCAAGAQEHKASASDTAKKIFKAWNLHDADKLAAFYTDDVVYEDVAYGDSAHGQAELKKFASDFFAAVPDLKIEVVGATVHDGRGSLEWVLSGTDVGLYKTGKKFKVRGASLFTMRGEKFASSKDFYDVATIMKQVGVLPPTKD